VQALLVAHKSMLANASHELRSPLARIRMGLALMERSTDTAAQRREIERNINELDELIDEILLASRLDLADPNDPAALGPLEEVDLLGLAAEECARTGAALEVAPDSVPPVMPGHAKLLRRLLRNLLENARRYGVRDGQPAEVSLTLRAVAHGCEIVVSDGGPGVPAALRERIFEPFFRLPGASEREGGVGLGLSLVKTIAERHGGQVRCEERSGGGAQFVVFLPQR
jgi:signal transduction histidine kinase